MVKERSEQCKTRLGLRCHGPRNEQFGEEKVRDVAKKEV